MRRYIMICREHFVPSLLVAWMTVVTSAAAAATRVDLTTSGAISVASDYEFSPDGQWLVLRGAAPNDGPAELYCLAATGGLPSRLSADLPLDRTIKSWRLGPTGSHVVYLADQDTLNFNEVFVAPMPGGAFYKLNDALVDSGSILGEFAGTTSGRVAYVAAKVTGPFTGSIYELFSVPTSGGEAIRLSGPMAAGGDVEQIIVQKYGDRVLYLADQEVDGKLELYSVAASGGSAVKLNPAISDVSDVLPDGIAFSADGSRVIFQIDRRPEKRIELFSVSAVGGPAVPLHPALPAGGNITPGSQRFSADGSRVLYHADQNIDEVFEVFSVPAGGGASVRLNGPLVARGDVIASGLQFSPDGANVLYLADQFVDEKVELFCVPSVGGTATKLSGDMLAVGDVETDAKFSPDGSHVLFRADQRTDNVIELFSTPITGGEPLLLNAPLVLGGNVVRFAFTPDGSEVIYLADQEVDEVFELFAVPSSGGAVRKLSGPLVAGGNVVDWKFSPDGSQLVYRADQDVDQLFQLYSVDLSDATSTLAGDFNRDGVVDAADYTKWRDGLGTVYTVTDYAHWKSNFGRRSGNGASAPGSAGGNAAAVPESASIGTLLITMACIFCRRRQSSQSCSFSRAGTYSSVT